MRRFKPRMDILPSVQQRVWPELRPAAALGLVLYGGTAIALRLGHRASVDFDFFTDQPLDKERLVTTFSFLARSTTIQDRPDTFTFLVPSSSQAGQQVKVSSFEPPNQPQPANNAVATASANARRA